MTNYQKERFLRLPIVRPREGGGYFASLIDIDPSTIEMSEPCALPGIKPEQTSDLSATGIYTKGGLELVVDLPYGEYEREYNNFYTQKYSDK